MSDLELFIISRWMYSVGEPILSDSEYQVLLDTMKVMYPDNEYVHRSWSSDPCPVDLLRNYGYSEYIRDIILLDKTESIPSIGSWALFDSMYRNINGEHTLSYKHDGWNIQISYYNGKCVNIQTRGRARDAISAEVLKSKIPYEIPVDGRYTVCAEATISDSDYMLLKEQLGVRSQRGAVSSCLARHEYTDLIQLHAFSIIGDRQVLNPFPTLEQWGFQTPRWVVVSDYEELISSMKEFSSYKQVYGLPTDGLIIRGDVTRAIRLMAWEEDVYKSYVVGYDETYGLHRVGVKVKIRPISMRNSTQDLVSVTNYQRVIDYNLRIGYPIAFKLVSMAIANIDTESTKLLQKEYDGKYEEYRRIIDNSEELKNKM